MENPHGQKSLAGYSPWGCKESDRTEQLSTAHNKNKNHWVGFDYDSLCFYDLEKTQLSQDSLKSNTGLGMMTVDGGR